MDMRRYLVMEKRGTNTVNAMMTNIENNGAPWHNQQDRLNGKMKINFSKLRVIC
jgi:hypothetical protein